MESITAILSGAIFFLQNMPPENGLKLNLGLLKASTPNTVGLAHEALEITKKT